VIHNVVRGIITLKDENDGLEWYKTQNDFTIQSYVVTSDLEKPESNELQVDLKITDFVTLARKNRQWFGDWYLDMCMSSHGMYLMLRAKKMAANMCVVANHYLARP
jgi:phage gp46-like protein